jgi:hypothetical protein
MGQGIMAAILLEMRIKAERQKEFSDFFGNEFYDNYTVTDDVWFTIKDSILLPNIKPILYEFAEISEDETLAEELAEIDQKNTHTSFWTFKDYADCESKLLHQNRNGSTPFIDSRPYVLRTAGCMCNNALIFYKGGYKAYLDDHITLAVLEKLVRRCMTNPLVQCVKFGMYG